MGAAGRDALRGLMLEKMEEFPILISPVCAIPAFRHRERNWIVRGQKVAYLKAMSYSQWWNILGFPAVVVPFAQSPEGLPIGVQIIGRPWRDEEVLAVAAQVESAGSGILGVFTFGGGTFLANRGAGKCAGRAREN